ncbi:MAG: diaminopimelate epimerase, partial [Oscillospiraceae bacterium]
MKFWKMNGAGNDFLILDNLEDHLPPERFPRLAKTLCERHLSLGADGLMVVDTPTAGGDYKMLFYNGDGSVGEMCGNGARCICRYGYETGLAGDIQRVETTAGLVTGQRIDRRHYRVRLNDPTVIDLHRDVTVDGVTYPCAYVELGSPGLPHAAVPMEKLADIPTRQLFDLGQKLRFHPAFPKGANVNFYEITGMDRVYERTFERGVEDFTYACGTGTGSVALVLTLLGQVSGKDVRVQMTGGELTIDIDRLGDTIRNLYLTGPTNLVAKGEI